MAWRKRVKGRPVSEFLSSQLLLPGRRCSAWHHEGGEESPRGLTREGSSRGSEGNQGEKSVARMSAQPLCLIPWDSGLFVLGQNGAACGSFTHPGLTTPAPPFTVYKAPAPLRPSPSLLLWLPVSKTSNNHLLRARSLLYMHPCC